METFQYVYTLNGYAHKFEHGDWLGRKLVGLAKVMINGIRLNMYATHVSFTFCLVLGLLSTLMINCY